ncbi:hypothetical protein [Halomonas mongoliensis]|uniref:hypothetical protein n=1 Tax=Halomonas mongoliensis TaxID=321265 RepID=UPI00403ADF8C
MATNKQDPTTALLEATMQGFRHVHQAIEQVQEEQRQQARATYKGLTSSGKARYAAALVDEMGSQAEVARTLKLTPGRINQLVKSHKNRQNGK